MRKNKNKDKLLARLFFNMLPVQILIFAMGSINSLVDGTMAGRFIGPSAVGVIGLYYSMVEIMSASGSVLLGGTAVLCGRFMGRGELDKTEGIFSLNLTVTFIIGALLTLVSILFPRPVAAALGANDLLMADLKTYIVGYGLGILPMLFAQQLAAFLQMERQSLRGYLGINEFAGFFIDKYADIFDIPSPEHTFAIRQVVRGHRKTDLWDSKEYPTEYRLPSGNTACLPYLAALIRMADEIDVAATRNPMILYDIDILTDEVEIVENKKVQAIRNIIMTENAFILSCSTDDEEIFNRLVSMVDKMQKTLDYCVEVVEKRTHFTISQKKVILKQI